MLLLPSMQRDPIASTFIKRDPRSRHMTTFDRREAGFENQYIHDQEIRFRAEARRNGLFGRWVTEKLELRGTAADDYVRDLVDMAVTAAGSGAVLRKVVADLTAKGVTVSEQAIKDKLGELLKVATEQIRAGQ
jgi:hypothetical protein